MQVRDRNRRRNRQSTSMSDMMTDYMNAVDEWNNTLYTPAMDVMQDMVDNWMDMMQQPTRRMMNPGVETRKRSTSSRFRGDCGCDCDQCACTICDADIAVYGRVGEQRVVPLVIENNRHRSRDIKIEISDFVKSDDKDVKLTAVLMPDEFTIEACSEQEVILGILMLPSNVEGFATGRTLHTLRDELKEAAEAGDIPDRTNIPDVESCTIFYADLRVEGCEMRPMRIAAVLLPRDCDPVEIDCGCGCC